MIPCEQQHEQRRGELEARRKPGDRARSVESAAARARSPRLLAEQGAIVIDADWRRASALETMPVRARSSSGLARACEASNHIGNGGRPGSTGKCFGAIVFADPMARRDLEAILHPRCG